MKQMKHYLIWVAVALLVVGGAFLVYGKVFGDNPGFGPMN